MLNPHLMRLLNKFGAVSRLSFALSVVYQIWTHLPQCRFRALRQELALLKCFKARLRVRLILHYNLPVYCYLIAESARRWRCAAAWSCRRSATSSPAFTLHRQPQGARGDNEGERLVVADEDNDYNGDDYSPISQILQWQCSFYARFLGHRRICKITGYSRAYA